MIFPIRATIFVAVVLALTFSCPAAEPAPGPAGKAKHVVIVVMDGLRPDSVVAEDMPTLTALGKAGVFFDNNHPVYLSTTEVNGTALATGMTPAHDGIIANREYRPDVELLRAVDTQAQGAIWKGDKLSNDNWILRPTLVELAREKGLKTAVAGTKGVALLWDRKRAARTPENPIVYEGSAIPAAVLDKITPDQGPFPDGVDNRSFNNTERDQWTVQALTEKLWADGVPALSVLWLSEPDHSQHGNGPGTKMARAALKDNDNRLAQVLGALEKKGVRDDTDVIVVSDHGFSSVTLRTSKIDLEPILRFARLPAAGAFPSTPEKDWTLVNGLGGSCFFYITGHAQESIDRLVSALQLSDFAGVIFTKAGGNGTFKFSDVDLDSANAPDVIVSMKWTTATPEGSNLPGIEYSTSSDYGMHGSLSRFDMHNTLIAAGPDFKKGLVNKLPSANSDVAPTVAQILGLTPAKPMDGRVLTEALAGGEAAKEAPVTTIMKANRGRDWQQYLKVTTYLGRRYYDEGNAGTEE